MTTDLANGEAAFYDGFVTQFFSLNRDGETQVTEAQRPDALALCKQADKNAALACLEAFGTTDFRDDLLKVSLPALILHGDSGGIVPFVGSGQRTHEAIAGSELHLIPGVPERRERQPQIRVEPDSHRLPRQVVSSVEDRNQPKG